MAAVASRPPVPASSAFVTAPSHSVDVASFSDYNFNASGSPMTTRLRASSDPLSRGGAFTTDQGLLEHEPNPFEQSFSGPHQVSGSTQPITNGSKAKEPIVNAVAGSSNGPAATRRARSNSPPAPRMTPGGVQKLPPLSLIGTPGNELTNFGWGVDSLRTGPLSPALLNGPQNPAHSSSLYDPANLRTGLTPISSGVTFPPPSPATAALFAMMTNNTPGTSDAAVAGLAGGGPRPHEGPNEGNPFDASYARATEGDQDPNGHPAARDSAADFPPHVQNQPLPLTAAHRSQLSSQLGSRPSQAIAPQVMHSSAMSAQMDPYSRGPYQLAPHPQMLPQHHPQLQQQPHHPRAQGPTTYGNQNPLYLLSQAQDLSNHNDDAVVAAAALSNLSGPGYSPAPEMANSSSMNGVIPGAIVGGGAATGMATRGQQQKLGSPASNGSVPAAKGKRAAATTANNKRKKAADEDKKPAAKKSRTARGRAVLDEDDDDDDDDDDGDDGDEKLSSSPKNMTQAETEEEKRKNFLERNRQAALKCRQRKKAWLANLQSKVELLTADNDTLQSTVTNLKDEVASLRAILAAHSNCPIAISNADRRGAAFAPAGVQRY